MRFEIVSLLNTLQVGLEFVRPPFVVFFSNLLLFNLTD